MNEAKNEKKYIVGCKQKENENVGAFGWKSLNCLFCFDLIVVWVN